MRPNLWRYTCRKGSQKAPLIFRSSVNIIISKFFNGDYSLLYSLSFSTYMNTDRYGSECMMNIPVERAARRLR